MARTTLIAITCDRCQWDQEYEYDPALDCTFGSEPWVKDWAIYWPASVTPTYSPAAMHGRRRDVCVDCLTGDERESLDTQRHAFEDVPF